MATHSCGNSPDFTVLSLLNGRYMDTAPVKGPAGKLVEHSPLPPDKELPRMSGPPNPLTGYQGPRWMRESWPDSTPLRSVGLNGLLSTPGY